MTIGAMIDLAWAELDALLSSLDEGALDLCRCASRREDAAAAFQIMQTVRAVRKASAAARTSSTSTASPLDQS